MSTFEVGDILTADALNAVAEPPLCRVTASGVQSLADATQVAIQFAGSDDIDTHGMHDAVTNNTRFTPNLPGYYRFNGTYFTASLVNGSVVDVNVRKNGSTNLPPADRKGGASGHTVTTSGTPSTIGGSNAFSTSTSVLVEMNGTTDYVELVARQDSNGARDTNQSSQFSCVFEGKFERPLGN
jgi:hypothetical protein